MDYVPKIDSCYFISLETASKAIGVLELVVYGVYFMYCYAKQLIDEIRPHDNVKVVIIAMVDSYVEQMGLLLLAAFGVYLIIGVQKKNHEFIISWIFLKISSIFISSLKCTYLILPIPGILSSPEPITRFIELSVLNVLEILLLFVILNYYRTISKGNLVEEEDN